MVEYEFSPPKAKAFWRIHLNAPRAFGGQTNIYYTYVLLCKSKQKNNFYIGYCKDLKKRVGEHLQHKIVTTRKFDKIKLIYYEACLNKTDAIKRELQLKTGFGRGYLKKRLESFLISRV